MNEDRTDQIPEDQDQNLEASEESQNQEPQKQTPDPISAALEEIKRIREESVQFQKQTTQAISTLATDRFTQQEEPDLDEEELENLDPATRKFVEKAIGKVAQVYQRDRVQDMAYRAQLERDRLAQKLQAQGMEDLLPEVDRYMDENQVNLALRATPGSYESALRMVLGEKALKGEIPTPNRTPNQSRTPSAVPPNRPVDQGVSDTRHESPEMRSLEETLSRRMGVHVEAFEKDILDAPEVSYDEWKAAQEREAMKRRRK